ncbi:Tim44 domain-containing protein [Halomonas cupida]|uniref:Tim44 domain-containing protein n=1 Tax=Halomonas TaxID=2745 RepID=UPI001A8EB2C7|nr:TIM44-like domain-containing protein [Halomonas litopenaei]MBN8411931.1 Tim44 domain-containing protein [Halomonas litopenaei]
MRHLLVMILVGVMGFGLAVDSADARRLGGGKSVGSFSRQASPSATQTQNTARPNAAPTAGKKSGLMGGMLGGLLAGSLLGALFFGGAFDGLGMVDILLMAGLAFLAFKLLARRRSATASAGGGGYGMQREQAPSSPFQMPGSSGTSGAAFGGPQGDPEWFDRERFLGGAKEHFMTLQRAWDNNDLPRIQEYVTPELYNLLREQRASEPANNQTEIVRLFAELGGVQELGTQAEARVLFHGVLNENGTETEFNETWHLVREMRDDAPWYVQGIEQNA